MHSDGEMNLFVPKDDDMFSHNCKICRQDIYLNEYGGEMGHLDWCTDEQPIIDVPEVW